MLEQKSEKQYIWNCSSYRNKFRRSNEICIQVLEVGIFLNRIKSLVELILMKAIRVLYVTAFVLYVKNTKEYMRNRIVD